MTKVEERLKERGYHYYCSAETVQEAKRTAKDLRELDMYATVISEKKKGVYYFSVWTKKNDGSVPHFKKRC